LQRRPAYLTQASQQFTLYMSMCSDVHKLASASAAACDAAHLDPNATEARRERLMPGADVQALAETFRILGDPTRVRILDVLASGELCVCDLAELVGISESAVSHQLRLLRGMRLVRPRRAGRQVYYSIDDHHIMSLFQQGLRHVTEERSGSITGEERASARVAERP
jgi:ArsR family transcriptional regulator, lead/cadmium/zinc/bismuth-responsive transcriptional repressor